MSNDRFVHANRGRRGSCCGDRHRVLYSRKLVDGRLELVETGRTDQDALIQSYARECDINYIIQRYANGDTSVLQRVQGVYTDVAGIDLDLTTAFSSVAVARDYYERLPLAVQREYKTLADFLAAVHIGGSKSDKEVTENVDA